MRTHDPYFLVEYVHPEPRDALSPKSLSPLEPPPPQKADASHDSADDDDELRDPKILLHKKRQLVHRIREIRDDKQQLEIRVGRLGAKQRRCDNISPPTAKGYSYITAQAYGPFSC